MTIRLASIIYWVIQRLFFYAKPLFAGKSRTQICSVIYKPDAIGDFLLSSGVISTLINQTNDKWILFCSPEVQALATLIFPDLECKVLTGTNQHASKAFWKKLRPIYDFRKSYQVKHMVCLKHALTGVDHIALNWLDPEISSGTVHSPIKPSTPASFASYHFTHPIPYTSQRKKYPLEIQAHLDVSNIFCKHPITEKEARPFLPVDTEGSKNNPILMIFPATRSALRNYSYDQLAEAVNDFLIKYPKFSIHLSGTPNQEQDLLKFKNMLTPTVNIIIVFPNSIIEAAKQIGKATIVVGMESAPTHIATTLNKPTIAILGGGHFNHFAPWGNPKRQIWLHHQLPCYQCNWSCKFSEPFCITRIDKNSILDHLLRLAMTEPSL